MSFNESNELEKHNIFDEDPGDLIQYVYKEIEILTIDGQSHRGWVYTVDPVSLSFGLVQFCHGEDSRIELIMGHAIKDIAILNDNVDTCKEALDVLFKTAGVPPTSSAELATRRENVISWLTRNRVPVQTCCDQPEVLSIGDVLRIRPPYSADDCQSNNGIILDKIQGLLRRMPNVNEDR